VSQPTGRIFALSITLVRFVIAHQLRTTFQGKANFNGFGMMHRLIWCRKAANRGYATSSFRNRCKILRLWEKYEVGVLWMTPSRRLKPNSTWR
jgi:hypothetical protein